MNFPMNVWLALFDEGEPESKTFTQEDLDKVISERLTRERQSWQTKIDELEADRKKLKLDAGDREALQKQIESLREASMTQEEIAKKNAEKQKKEAEEALNSLKGEAESWRSKYTVSTIERSLVDAASSNDAYKPSQIVAILKNSAELVPITDEDGQETGNFEVKVKISDGGKTLTMSPNDAVKHMVSMDEYLNLFKSNERTGFSRSGNASGGPQDIAELARTNPKEYIKRRKSGQINL